MVTQLKFNPHWTELLGQGLGKGISGGFEGYQKGKQAKAEQQQAEQEKEQVRDFYRSKDMDPALADQPQFIQSAILNRFLKPKTWMESLGGAGSRALGMQPQQRVGAAPQDQTLNIGGQNLPMNAFSQGTQQALQMEQAEEPTWTQSGVGFGTGLAATALQRSLGWVPDIASAGLKGLGAITPKLFEGEQQQRMVSNLKEALSKVDPNSDKAKDLKAYLDFVESPPDLGGALTSAAGYLPTTENIERGIEKTGEAVGLGEYFGKAPHSKMLGNITGALTKAAPTVAGWGKNLAKAFAVGLGGDAAGYLTEDLTGSKLAGNVVRGGIYGLYSILPGTLGSMSAKRFEDVNNVIQQADKQGMLINGKVLKDEYNALENTVKQHLGEGSEARRWMDNALASSDSLFKGPHQLTPSQLNNKTQELMGLYSDAPAQAKALYQKLIDLERKLLGNNLNTVKSGAGNTLNEAYKLAHANYQVQDGVQTILNTASPRKNALAAGALFGGGYKALLGLAGSASGVTYLKKFFSNPIVQADMAKLAKATATNNVGTINAVMKKLDKDIEQTLKRLPKKAQEEVREVLKQHQGK